MDIRIVFSPFTILFPLLVGGLFIKTDKPVNLTGLSEAYLLGQFCIWAVFQLIAVPMIQLKWRFNVLFITSLLIIVTLSIFGAIRIKRATIIRRLKLPESEVMKALLFVTAGIILYQASMYIFGMHLDEDDARWLAEANDALVKGPMMIINPATGEYLGIFIGDMIRDSTSPWPMYIAFLSRLTGINVPTIAHTVYAPILLITSYIVFFRIGRLLFKGKDEQVIFLFAVSVIMMYFGGQKRSENVMALVRIWQGKAVTAAIAIPVIFSQFLKIHKEDTIFNWLVLIIITSGSCFLSGMGILLSGIMVGGYGLYAIIVCQKWKRIPLWLIALLPAAGFEWLYQSML